MKAMRRIALMVGIAAAAAVAPSSGNGTAAEDAMGDWRRARWGMTVEEVLSAFPGEAARIDPEERLADGNVVAVGIDGQAVGQERFRVRFVFEAGRLALVSLRTPPDHSVDAAVYERLQKELAREFKAPGEASQDANFIDLRQTRWRVGRSLVDLKYIPGTVVILYSPGASLGR